MLAHVRAVHQGRRIRCPHGLCARDFSDRSGLRKHVLRHHAVALMGDDHHDEEEDQPVVNADAAPEPAAIEVEAVEAMAIAENVPVVAGRLPDMPNLDMEMAIEEIVAEIENYAAGQVEEMAPVEPAVAGGVDVIVGPLEIVMQDMITARPDLQPEEIRNVVLRNYAGFAELEVASNPQLRARMRWQCTLCGIWFTRNAMMNS